MKMIKKILLMTFTMMVILTMTFNAYAAETPLDGSYKVGLTFTGGTGKVTAKSPTELTVSGGKMTAKVILTSSNYTYMIVNGTTYDNTAATGQNSTFIIPISALDRLINVTACTVAMSTPHEIDYTIKVSSEGTISKDKGTSQNTDKTTNQGTNQSTNQNTVSNKNDSKNTNTTKSDSTKEAPKSSDGESLKTVSDTKESPSKNEEIIKGNTPKKDEKNVAEVAKGEELSKESVQLQSASPTNSSSLIKIITGIVVIIGFIAVGIILKKRKSSNK